MTHQNGKPYDDSNSEALEFLRNMVADRPGGENRPQQEHAVVEIENAIQSSQHLLVEAGTGTGKSFATAIPAILSGKRFVYSTATKSLSEQIINQDIPVLKAAMKKQHDRSFSAVLLKGRDNYACLQKINSLKNADEARPDSGEQQSLLSDDEVVVDKKTPKGKMASLATQYKEAYAWVEETETGDRSEAPPVSDEVWRGLSSTTKECVGRSACPFGEQCFAEIARDNARMAQVVVTNHAITALDIESPDSPLLGEREVFVIDEIHELDNYLSNAWGTTITEKSIADALILSKKFKAPSSIESSYNSTVLNMTSLLDKLSIELEDLDDGLFPENEIPMGLERVLSAMKQDTYRLVLLLDNCEENATRNQTLKAFKGIAEDLTRFLIHSRENVRWVKNEKTVKETFFRKKKKDKATPVPVSLHCAPLRIGPRLMKALHQKDATMIGTSATIKVAGKFDSPIHELSLNENIEDKEKGTLPPRQYKAVDVGTPFDYARQAMLYIPDSKSFPEPVYKTIEDHSAAVEETVEAMISALGGRALILLTTTPRVKEVGEYLEATLPSKIKVLKQEDAPANQLIEEFVRDETSVLVATMGMWHGLNASGPTCSLVVMDKIPFASANDPLTNARKNYADEQGRNGFMEVPVAKANVKLAQGFGRLVRSMSDRGVVAILDTRLQTKAYGRAMLKSLPDNVSRYSNLETVLGSLGRLRESLEKR